MKIVINDHRKIFAVQKEFSDMFPYLKIEFFSKPKKPGASSSKKMMKHPSKTLGECRVVHTKGMLSIRPSMTVGDLQQIFRDIYGLSIQVFRKSGNLWHETNTTYKWTLAEQNKQGVHYLQKELIADNHEAE